MVLNKRNCGMEIKLVPYGSGWTDVYLNIGEDKLYFVISNVIGHQFSDLMRILCFMYPQQQDLGNADHIIESKIGIKDDVTGEIKIYDSLDELIPQVTYLDIPWRAEFTWNEEGSESHWCLERAATMATDFMLDIAIKLCRDKDITYSYTVPYKDFCYAVAKACTAALKEYGFFGYHFSTNCDDINLPHLLFLKALALNCLDTLELSHREIGKGSITSFEKELELLLFDM